MFDKRSSAISTAGHMNCNIRIVQCFSQILSAPRFFIWNKVLLHKCLILEKSNKVQFYTLAGSIAILAHFGHLAQFCLKSLNLFTFNSWVHYWMAETPKRHTIKKKGNQKTISELAKHIFDYYRTYFPQNFDPDLQSEYEESEG